MKFKTKITLGNLCLSSLLLKNKKPIFVAWVISERCNLKCSYCHAWKSNIPELDTEQVLKIIELLFKGGTRMIRFTGGEPLLRADIADIIKYSKNKGIFTTVASNGILVPEKIECLRNLNEINISVDGTEEIHDAIRGRGSYRKAIEACGIVNFNKIPLTITTVLTAMNLDNLEHLLAVADNFRAKIFFQRATENVLFTNERNTICPEIGEFKKAVRKLMLLKRTSKFIGNTQAGLEYMLNSFYRNNLDCVAGKIFFRLDPQGNIYRCERSTTASQKMNLLTVDMEHCLNQAWAMDCNGICASALIELNTLSRLNLSSLLEFIFT
jgi:MoaA/NifB/PqqE/SkfB family radical SAM enzyme